MLYCRSLLLYRAMLFMAIRALTCCYAQAAANKYDAYINYSAVVVDSSPGQFVPSASDCIALSTIAPYTNSVSYNDAAKQCKVLPATNNEILVELRKNTGWVTYVKDISDDDRVVFKATGSITSQTSADLNTGNVYLGSASVYLQSSFSAAMSPNCSCLYRNPIIDFWNISRSAVSIINVQVVSYQIVVAAFVYNGVGSNAADWYTQNKLIGAYPYNFQGLRLTTFSSYTIPGGRSFAMGFNFSTCSIDSYYFLSSIEYNGCAYTYPPYPQLLYAATQTGERGLSLGAKIADYFIISARFINRVKLT